MPTSQVEEGDEEEGEDGEQAGLPEEGRHWAKDRVNSFVVLDRRGKSGEVTGAPLSISLVHNPQVDPVCDKHL